MLISIVGNIGVGKTTYINKIKKLKAYKSYKIFSLDDFRRKYNKQETIQGEEMAQLELIHAIGKYRNIILESSGTGKWYQSYIREYTTSFDDPLKVILLEDTKTNCLKRHEHRIKEGYKMAPFPYPMSIESGINWIHDKLQNFNVKNKIKVNKDPLVTFKKIKENL